MKCRYICKQLFKQVKRVHLEKATASASISEAAQEVLRDGALHTVQRPCPTVVVVAVNNEVESKSQRFCERCTDLPCGFFLQALAGHYSRSSTAHGNKIAYIMVVHWWRTSRSKAYCCCADRGARSILQELIGFLQNFANSTILVQVVFFLVFFILILELLEQQPSLSNK